jgi:HAD superfamily hydrolase (TIGR01509 family)
VLVGTHGHWDRAYAALFAGYGVPLRRDDRRRLVGLGLERLGHALADLLGHPVPPKVLAQQIRELVATDTGAGVVALPGARELVTALAGTRPLAITSNSPVEITRDYLRTTGIPADVFYTIVGAGDTDHPKPAPALYQETCRRLNVPPSRVVVLEDSIIGVQAARAAGTTVFAIPNLPETRPIAHRSFPTLADPEPWVFSGSPQHSTPPPSRDSDTPGHPGAPWARHCASAGSVRIAAVPHDDLESRVTSLEHEVVRLREQVAITSSDAAAARVLASGADRDVSEVRAELRAHTQGLNALRETQLELRETQLEQGRELVGLRQEMREGFATLSTGMAEIAMLLTKITAAEQGN